jgi:7-cyano-7-deazaguanine reductase
MKKNLTENLTKLGNSKVEYTNQYDKSQLEPIPRAPRRTTYTAPMIGGDVWTCFEVSFLTKTGLPWTGVLRIVNPASSTNIFESKSLKLYLNSFNNTVFNSVEDALKTIEIDLTELAGAPVSATQIKKFNDFNPVRCLEIEFPKTEVTEYEYNPKLLKVVKRKEQISTKISCYSDLLRSNCEITNQPDWGRVSIEYKVANKYIDPQSLLKYIVSFRNHQEFHEPTCERIYNDLYELLQPEELTVICQYTRRGGIDINPIRTTNPSKVNILIERLPKLLQQ